MNTTTAKPIRRSFISRHKKSISAIFTTMIMSSLMSVRAFAAGGDDGWSTVVGFIEQWLPRIGGAVLVVGLVMFAISWARQDADSKSNALFIVMAGGMVLGVGELVGGLLGGGAA
jgi:hypothetical protein